MSDMRADQRHRCLQEVTYLTSPGALNPLPPRPFINLSNVTDSVEQSTESAIPPRPKKALPEENLPPTLEKPKDADVDAATASSEVGDIPQSTQAPDSSGPVHPVSKSSTSDSATSSDDTSGDDPKATLPMLPTKDAPLSSTSVTAVTPTSDADLPASGSTDSSPAPAAHVDETSTEDHQVLTAIYKPESKAAWREELRAANEVAEKVRYQW